MAKKRAQTARHQSRSTTVMKRPLLDKLDIRHHVLLLFLFLVVLGFHQASLDTKAEATLRHENMILKQQIWEKTLPDTIRYGDEDESEEI